MYLFEPPVVEEGPAGFGALFSRYRINRGITILKFDGEYYEVRSPSQEEINEAEVAYRGGYQYQVTEEEANNLINAGYVVVVL